MEPLNPRFYSFRIAIDWHRTVDDIGREIKQLAYRRFGINIPITHACRRLAVGYYLTKKQYDEILKTVIENAVYINRYIREIPGSMHTISQLKSDGHRVEVVTSSGTKGHLAILKRIQHRRIDITTRSVGRRILKGIVARDYDVALEDSPEQAESYVLHGTPFVYLLDSPTNQDQPTPERVMRVPNHFVFLAEVRRLHKRLFPQSP